MSPVKTIILFILLIVPLHANWFHDEAARMRKQAAILREIQRQLEEQVIIKQRTDEQNRREFNAAQSRQQAEADTYRQQQELLRQRQEQQLDEEKARKKRKEEVEKALDAIQNPPKK